MTRNRTGRVMPSPAAQWFGLLAAPAAYGLVAFFTYAIAPAACATDTLQFELMGISVLAWVTFLVSLLGLVLALAGGYVAYRNWVRARQAGAESDDRPRFLGAGGILMSAVFFALTLFAGLSGLAFQPCRPV